MAQLQLVDVVVGDNLKRPKKTGSPWLKMPLTNNNRDCLSTDQNVAQKRAQILKKKMRNLCTLKMLQRKLPITNWLPKYQLSYLHYDIVTGITVALTVIPQGMAYANLAGLPLQYGLYTSFMGLFTYCIFGTLPMIHIGPTSMMAILILDYVIIGGPVYAAWLSFLSGCIEILLGLFGLGCLVNFISVPVASGFSSAASVIVIGNLFKSIFGLKFSSSNFLELVYKFIIHIPETNYWDLILGTLCFLVLAALKKFNEKIKSKGKTERKISNCRRIGLSILWFLVTARNAVVVLVAATCAYLLSQNGYEFLTQSADVKPGLPEFQFPPLERQEDTVGFMTICTDLGWGTVLVSLVAILQHIAIAKSFAHGSALDANQEVVTLGLCNIIGSFVSAFPVTASFSRTALNVSTGIKSTLAGVFTGALVLVAIAVLAPSFRYIPKATLAAVIIYAVFTMIEYQMIPLLWKTKRSDLAVWLVTFFGCLVLKAEYGILVGIGFSLLILLYSTFKPHLTLVHHELPQSKVLIIEPDRALYFPSAEYMRYKVNKISKDGMVLPVVLDGSHICGIDYTTAEGIQRLVEDFKKRNRVIIFTNFKDEVLRILKSVGSSDFIYCQTPDDLPVAIQESTTRALDKGHSEKYSLESPEASSGNLNNSQSKYSTSYPTKHVHASESAVLLLPSLSIDGDTTPECMECIDETTIGNTKFII